MTHSNDVQTLGSNATGTSSGSWSSPIVAQIPVTIPVRNLWTDIAESSVFRNLSLVLIMVNALWIGADTEWNHISLLRNNRLPLEPASVVVELTFSIGFTVELVVRFLAFERKSACFRDAWFVFDTLLLAFMWNDMGMLLVEVNADNREESGGGALGPISLLRLLRLTRLVRLMRFFPELMTLVKGMFRAMESVFYVLVFMLIMIYGTAIIFTIQLGCPPSECPPELMEESEDPTTLDMFGDIGSSMMTLLTNGVLADNLRPTLMTIKAESLTMMFFFLAFVLVSGITLLNMLIGVLCKVVQDTAQSEDEQKKAFELRDVLCKAFNEIDTSNDGHIQEQEWSGIQKHPEVRKSMYRLGIDEGELDVRLTQLRAKVFWDRPRLSQRMNENRSLEGSGALSDRFTRRSSSSSMGTGSSCSEEENPGLDFESFVDQVSELDWNKTASALEIETFKCDFLSETKTTKRMLEDVEEMLQEILERRGMGDDAPSPARSSRSRKATPSAARRGPTTLRPPTVLPPAPHPPETPSKPKARLPLSPLPPAAAPPSLAGAQQEEGGRRRLQAARSRSSVNCLASRDTRDADGSGRRRNTVCQFSEHSEELMREAARRTGLAAGESSRRSFGPVKSFSYTSSSSRDKLASVSTEALMDTLRQRLRGSTRSIQRKLTTD